MSNARRSKISGNDDPGCNVIALNVPFRLKSLALRQADLIAAFAQTRRIDADVFWLKENAELLNILECTGARLPPEALAPHRLFYEQIEKRMGFFPQYYRFLLSICLDLEDLGIAGSKGAALCRWIAGEGLAEGELSDLQRLEARRLMQRRGIDPMKADPGLDARVRQFMERTDTFAMPNRKAAYELTHSVFYLSEYGRRDPQLSDAAITSLEFVGILAFLDQDTDLLAEVCIALRYAGRTPSGIWERWLETETRRFAVETGPQVTAQDEYHDYFVCNWLMATAGHECFAKGTEAGQRVAFFRRDRRPGPLRALSECMFRLEDARSDDWDSMRPLAEAALTAEGRDILGLAQASTNRFAEFFAGFARTGLRGVPI